MRIVVDLDNTICEEKLPNEHYSEVKPIKEMVEFIQDARMKGDYIIIHTARGMESHSRNIGSINANVAPTVVEWLRTHDIPFDEIHYGKPYGDMYIDDKAIRPAEILELNKLTTKAGRLEDIVKIYFKLKQPIQTFIKNLFI